MNYEKLTVDRFALNLREGKYETLTGARRAIGKTSSWGSEEKEKAQKLANKHFNASDTPVPAKKAEKKMPLVRAAAPAKKAARKAAKKAAKAPVQKLSDVTETVMRTMEVKQDVAPKASKATVTTGNQLSSFITCTDAVSMGRSIIVFVREAREEYNAQKALNPSADFTRLLTDMKDATSRAVTLVSINVPNVEEVVDTALPPARVSPPKAPEAPKSSPAPKRAPAPAPVMNAAPTPTLAASGASPAYIEPAPPPAEGTSTLSPEDQSIANALRNSTPASTIPALPRPIAPQG